MSIKQRALASLSLSPAAMSQHHTQPTRSAIRTVPGVRGVVALMATVWIAFPMSAYAQTISAKPAEVVFYTKSATTQKSTTIS
jgi:hypothetical protein